MVEDCKTGRFTFEGFKKELKKNWVLKGIIDNTPLSYLEIKIKLLSTLTYYSCYDEQNQCLEFKTKENKKLRFVFIYWKGRFSVLFITMLGDYADQYDHYESLLVETIRALADIGNDKVPLLKKVRQITPALKLLIQEEKALNLSFSCVEYFCIELQANTEALDKQLVDWLSSLQELFGEGRIFSSDQQKLHMLSIFMKARKLGAFKQGSEGFVQAQKIINNLKV